MKIEEHPDYKRWKRTAEVAGLSDLLHADDLNEHEDPLTELTIRVETEKAKARRKLYRVESVDVSFFPGPGKELKEAKEHVLRVQSFLHDLYASLRERMKQKERK